MVRQNDMGLDLTDAGKGTHGFGDTVEIGGALECTMAEGVRTGGRPPSAAEE